MPNHRAAFIFVALDLTAEEVSRAETDFAVGRFTVDERGKVVVHNVVAEPPAKQLWLKHQDLMIAHLVVRYENRPSPRPTPLGVPRLNIQILPLASIGLGRDRS